MHYLLLMHITFVELNGRERPAFKLLIFWRKFVSHFDEIFSPFFFVSCGIEQVSSISAAAATRYLLNFLHNSHVPNASCDPIASSNIFFAFYCLASQTLLSLSSYHVRRPALEPRTEKNAGRCTLNPCIRHHIPTIQFA